MENEQYLAVLAKFKERFPPFSLLQEDHIAHTAHMAEAFEMYGPALYDLLRAQGLNEKDATERHQRDVMYVWQNSMCKKCSHLFQRKDTEVVLDEHAWLAAIFNHANSGNPITFVQGDLEQDGIRYRFARPLFQNVRYLTKCQDRGPLTYRIIQFVRGQVDERGSLM